MKLHLILLIFLVSCLPGKSSGLNSPSKLSSASNKLGSYEVYAHRGDFKFYAENTKKAFIDAFEKANLASSPNIVGIELDVQITGDGEIVVLHDQTLARTTFDKSSVRSKYLNAPIETLNYQDIKNTQLGPKKTDTLITLGDAVDLIRDDYKDKKILIELKSYKDAPAELTQKMLESLEKSLKGYNQAVLERLSLISFDEEILKGVAKFDSLKSVKRYSIYLKEDMEKLGSKGLSNKMKELKELGFAGIDLEMGDYLKDSKAIQLAHDNGLKVITWPYFAKRGDGPRYQALARDVGVDIFTSDLPADTVLPSRLLKRAEESLGLIRNRLKGYSIEITDNNVDGIYYYQIKNGDSNFRAALYAPNQSDFSRGVDVSISKPPSDKELRAAMEIDIKNLKNNSDFIVANFADSGIFSKQFQTNFKIISEELGLRSVIIDSTSSNLDLNSVDEISKNLKRNLKLMCN